MISSSSSRWLLWFSFAVLLSLAHDRIVASEALHEHAGVVELHDESFVSTTTSSNQLHQPKSWLIWFHSTYDDTHITGEYPSPETWSQLNTVLASVNVVTDGTETAKRFGIQHTPAFVLIQYHHQALYRYPRSSTEAYDWHDVLEFVRHPATYAPEEIPAPPSLFTHWRFKLRRNPTLLVGAMVVVLLVFGLLVSSVRAHLWGPAPPRAKEA